MKAFVYTAYKQNEEGFTFVSLLLMISILAIFIPFLSYTLKAADIPSSNQEISVQQFFQFLRDDVIMANEVDSTRKRLYLKQGQSGDQVVIKRHGDLVHRQVNRRGHEIYLQDIQDVTFSKVPYGIRVNVRSLEGESYEKTIIYYQ